MRRLQKLSYSFEISLIDWSSKKVEPYFFQSELSPVVELCPFQRVIMNFCNQDIFKSIAARSFKLSQLIEDNE